MNYRFDLPTGHRFEVEVDGDRGEAPASLSVPGTRSRVPLRTLRNTALFGMCDVENTPIERAYAACVVAMCAVVLGT